MNYVNPFSEGNRVKLNRDARPRLHRIFGTNKLKVVGPGRFPTCTVIITDGNRRAETWTDNLTKVKIVQKKKVK